MQISSRFTGIEQGFGPRAEGPSAADRGQDDRLDAFLKACSETFGPGRSEPDQESRPKPIPSTHMRISDEEMRMLQQMFEARLARLEARIKDQLNRNVEDIRNRVASRLAVESARNNATPKTSVKSG